MRCPRGFLVKFLGQGLCLWLMALSLRGEARTWPFDQRQILLTRVQGREFPDDLTVAQVLDIFVQKGRVRWVLQKGGRGQILPVEIPADFPWQSSLSVKQLGLKHKVDGIVLLSLRGTELDLKWYSVADGEPMFFEKVNLPQAGARKEDQDMRRKRLADFLEDIWLRIPGRGYIVRRDMTTVSFEGGNQLGVKVGDVIEIKRLEQAERHPLLKTFIGIHSTLSGTAVVTQVADPLSVAKIDYESQADPIQEGDRYDVKPAAAKPAPSPAPVKPEAPAAGAAPAPGDRKVIPVQGDSKTSAVKAPDGEGEKVAEDEKEEKAENDKVTTTVSKFYIVDLSGSVGWGSMKHDEAISGASKEIAGSGPSLDMRARGYLTAEWILDAHFGFRQYSPETIDSSYGVNELAASIMKYRIGAGYRFVFLDDPYIPGEFSVGAGYQRYSFSITRLENDFAPVGKAYSGFDIALSLKVPVYDRFAAFAGGSRMLAASLTETPITTGNSTGSVVWGFDAGVLYKISGASLASAGIESTSATTNFEGNGERTIPAVSNILSTTTFFGSYIHRF